ncbi:MAG: mismatch-specific DNA-glycosylase [Nitrospirota bacterium]|nr:mismatch-specific DNA-glycosylase [Nitrospirota bacterium]
MKGLPDYIEPGVQILLVGINPGLRSAQVGHHFAGHSNRFWKLMFDAGLITEPLKFHDDWRLPEWGLGLTNMITRPTAGSADLSQSEYHASCHGLKRKVEKFRPAILALLGLTLGSIFSASCQQFEDLKPSRPSKIQVGVQPYRLADTQIFVLPNPSGRNAHYTYQIMLNLYQGLQRLGQGVS